MSIKSLNRFDRITVGVREFDDWDFKLYKLERFVHPILYYLAPYFI